ncbi:L-aspartate dehydrogenase [Pseudoclavibacter triregionum]|nr:L-aspartate dehydrogenase [Pseudoclavibacter triregionum]
MTGSPAAPARLGLIGFGALGRELIRHLRPEFESGRLLCTGAIVRDVVAHGSERDRRAAAGELPPGWPTTFPGVEQLVDASDLVVEVAGVQPAWEYGAFVVKRGRTLLLASVGVLADERRAAVLEAGPGELLLTAGAVGGLDLLRATAQADGLDELRLTTRKAPATLLRPWMAAEERERLAGLPADAPAEMLFEGSPAEAIRRFPANVNVAVAIADASRRRGAAGELEPRTAAIGRMTVRLVADPSATDSVHLIEAAGAAGHFRFELANRPSRANPRSSALTAQSLALDVRGWLARRG